jgi:hypothetical protein
MMKRCLVLFAVTVLWCASCENGSGGSGSGGGYPSLEYRNESSWDITAFKNAAKESYTLARGQFISLPSDKRGRADIIEIKPPYVTWEQNGDMYHIRFVDGKKIELEIENYMDQELILTERDGYLYPETITVSAAVGHNPTLPSTATATVYTAAFSLAAVDTYGRPIDAISAKIKSKKIDAARYAVAIDPPGGWKQP